MRVRPLHDWVLVERTEAEEKTAGGIIIPSSAQEKPSEGIVQAVGPGRYKKEKGKQEKKFIPTVLKPGQRIVFVDYKARDVDFDGGVITLIREDDVLGLYEGVHHAKSTEAERPVSVTGTKSVPEKAKKVTPKKAVVARKKKPTAQKAKAEATKTAATGKKVKKPAAKNATAKKTAPKKAAVKKPKKADVSKKTAKKPAAKKAVKKTAAKKPVSKRTAPKKRTVKRTASKAKKRTKK